MKNLLFYMVGALTIISFLACKKEYVNYPEGYDHMYYAFFDYNFNDPARYNSNLTVTLKRDHPDLVPIRVKFMSEFKRDYDVSVKMYVQQRDSFYIAVKLPSFNMAKHGIDYELLDSAHNVIQPVEEDGLIYFTATFPGAKKGVQTFYLKLLNYTADNFNKAFFFSFSPNAIKTGGTEDEFIMSAMNNKTPQYSVLSYSNAYFRRFNINK